VAFPWSGWGPDVALSVPDWLTSLIQRYAPEDLRNNQTYLATVAAAAHAESGWNVNSVQHGFRLGSGAGARGLWQFDMGGMGKPWLSNEGALLGMAGADLQASRIVPLFAENYRRFSAQGYQGAELASIVAGYTERPYDYQNPNSTARRNYAASFQQIVAGGLPIPLPWNPPAPTAPGPAQEPTPGQMPAPPTGGAEGAPASAPTLDFGQSLWHVLVSIALFLLALMLIIGGVWLLTSSASVKLAEAPAAAPVRMARGAAGAEG
jgi:hypothetical protein